MSIHIQLERFEGPLGLLLHLIRQHEMDIFNININQITKQYLEYIKAMRRLDLEVAGEFVAMAATLLHIKSKTLLPQYGDDGEVVEEDPRKELVQKLVEYKKFRELSVDLYKRPLLGRDVFARGESPAIESDEEGEIIVEENPLFSLISTYRAVIRSMKSAVHKVAGELKSIAERILEIKDFLVVGQRVRFGELITDSNHRGNQVLVTFLSLLELAKIGLVSLFQTDTFGDIYVEAKRSIDRDVVSQVENYDAVNTEQKAEEIMAEAQLSLDESSADEEFTLREAPIDETGQPVVAENALIDAATDEEIEAEERRLLGESEAENSHIEETVMDDVSSEPIANEGEQGPNTPNEGVEA